MISIGMEAFKIAFPSNTEENLSKWIEPMKAACQEFGIDTQREICSFLANISVESNDLRTLVESLNYRVEGILKTFGRHRISEADARRLGRKPGEGPLSEDRQRQLANILYGGEFGKKNLGNIKPNDGWDFRGHGPKQTTGRSNTQKVADYLKIPIEQVPAYVITPVGGSRSAGFFWKTHDLDAKAATIGLEDDRRAINGGLLGLDVVTDRFNKLMKL